MKSLVFTICFLFCLGFNSSAQKAKVIIIPDSLKSKNYFNLNTDSLVDKNIVTAEIRSKVDSLRSFGYLTASIDSITSTNDSITFQLFLGNKYDLETVENKNIDPETFEFYFPKNAEVSFETLPKKKEQLLEHYVDKGYINASISQKASSINANSISLQLELEQGPLYTLDSIILVGNLDIKPSYILSLLNTKPGDVLNQNFFRTINERIANSSFMEQTVAPAFTLKEDGKANVYLNINERKANQFDLLIGFQPNPNPRISNTKLLVTGNGSLRLFNPFGTGKEFQVDYEQRQPESPKMNIELDFPQLFDQEFGLTGAFNLYKQDSSFVKLYGQFGLAYPFGGNKNLALSYQRTRSYLQDVDTSYVIQNQSLPQSIDYNQNYYLAEFKWQATNRLRNPSKGFFLNTSAGVGNRRILENRSVIDIESSTFDYSTLYNGVNEQTFSWQASVFAQYFIPLSTRHVALLQNNSASREYNQFFVNDLYRLGGINSIRGFDEQSYLASRYFINTAEYRFLLNRDSYFSVFGDWAILEDKRPSQSGDNLLGLGTGLNLTTKAGLFSLNLAVGKSNETSFDFNRTRIHIGYVNLF